MRTFLSLTATAAILCSFASPAFAANLTPSRSSGDIARGSANKGLFGVMHDRKNDARISGDLPKMYSGSRALPFYKGIGASFLRGSSATRVGFRFAGREKETSPVLKDGKVVGQKTVVVTRLFNRGSETVTVKTAQGQSHSEYKYRQSLFGRVKSWQARSTSTEMKDNHRTATTTASASGGDNHTKGMHSAGKAESTVTRGKAVIGHATLTSSRGWSD